MVMIAENIIDTIKQNVSVERIMKEMYGKDVKDNTTICDFHSDSSPSLHIFPDGGYKCFVCGAGKSGQDLKLPDGQVIVDGGNNIFGYVMNKERVSFPESVRILGKFFGIDVPQYRPDPEAEKMKEMKTVENREFRNHLLADPDALRYLAERGIDKHDIDKWRMGMVPWNWAKKSYAGRIVFGMAEAGHAEAKGPTIAMAYRVRQDRDYAQHGWLRDEMEQHLKAKFNEDGSVRSLNPKYYNDPKSKIYDKGSFLYGMDQADLALRAMPHDKRYLVVVEGYVDVIMSHKSGLATTVACCGSSITDQQADEIARRVKRVYLWLDGDAAGQEGMLRALPKLLQRGCEVLIVNSPMMDPAEIVQNGQELTSYIATHAKPAVQLLVNQQTEEYDRLMSQARMKAMNGLLPLLDSIADPIAKMNYRNIIEKRLDLTL